MIMEPNRRTRRATPPGLVMRAEEPEAARREALLDLVALRRPVRDAIARLGSFPRDSDRELVVLTRTDLIAACDAHLAGRLSSEELESWAEHIECPSNPRRRGRRFRRRGRGAPAPRLGCRAAAPMSPPWR